MYPKQSAIGMVLRPIRRYFAMMSCVWGVMKLVRPRRGPTGLVPAWEEL